MERVKKNFCLIKSSTAIRKALHKKIFDDYAMTLTNIIDDAEVYGRRLDKAALSRYFKHGGMARGSLSQEQIVWLCVMYGVKLRLNVKPEMKTKKERVDDLYTYFPGDFATKEKKD